MTRRARGAGAAPAPRLDLVVPRVCRSWLALAGLLLLAASAGAHAAVDLERALASLREAAARHPTDPDYSWALADALEAAGRDADAAQQMRAHLARWPDRPGHGWRALGRCEYRAGRFEPARDAAAHAVARDPRDAEARLYLGLALRALGESVEAEKQLERVAELDPELAADALLLAGVSHLSRGNTEEGQALLDRVMSTAPSSASARDARSLANRMAPTPSPLRLDAFTGFSYDSNATLEGGSDLPGVGSANGDYYSGFGARLRWRPPLPWQGEFRPVQLTALYERFDYLELDEYSQQRATGGASWTHGFGDDVALRLHGTGSLYLVENDPYLVRGQLQPNLYVALGERRGVLRLHGIGEVYDYDEDPVLDSWERNGWVYGGGLEHQLDVGREGRRGYLAWGASYERYDTASGRDLLQFENAYENHTVSAAVRGEIPLLFGIRAAADFSVDNEFYDHRNSVDALSESPTSPDRRRDRVVSSELRLRRRLYGPLEVELGAAFEDRDSNVDLYAYRRATGGIRFHAMFP